MTKEVSYPNMEFQIHVSYKNSFVNTVKEITEFDFLTNGACHSC